MQMSWLAICSWKSNDFGPLGTSFVAVDHIAALAIANSTRPVPGGIPLYGTSLCGEHNGHLDERTGHQRPARL
jgi:hypothetical protein